MEELYLKTRGDWRKWLSKNRSRSEGVWLVFYKKGADRPSLEYDDAVEEALCFGWIDSVIKKIDDHKYVRKFTPRKPSSNWSDLNKKRVAKLVRTGLMTNAGLALVDEAKKSGQWDKPDPPSLPPDLPDEFKAALAKNKKAKTHFDNLAPSYKKQFIGWISFAKRPETRAKRVAESIALLERGEKLGMK
ncbi:MAG: YdeI/OmpD-associated family protein [Candidatus Zixiibacteriota bacterium]